MTTTSTSSSSSKLTVSEEDAKIQVKEADNVPKADEEADEGSDEHLQKCLKDSNELKKEGTEHFRAERWTQALAIYSSAVGRLPKRVKSSPLTEESENTPEDEVDEESPEIVGANKDKGKEPEHPVPPLTGLQLDCAKARAVMNANIGACHVKLGEYKEAVKACSEDDPNYVKALQRRAMCNEKIGTWSALTSAQDDYNTLLKILPPDSPHIGPTRRSLASIAPRAEAAQKKETAEVLDKLKGLGNSILGNFGLSTDNFKFVPNGQGGYSMNFSR